MNKIHQYTREVMTIAGQPTKDVPTIPPVDEMKRCLALEFEELFEKAEAMGLMGSFESIIDLSMLKRFNEMDENAPEFNSLSDDVTESAGYFKDTNVVNMVEVFDAACDQNVVWSGTNQAFGFAEAISDGDDETQRSNLSKFDTDEATARAGVEAYRNGTHPHGKGKHMECDVYPNNGYFVIRTPNGKYLKSLHYSPTSLEPILKKHGYEPSGKDA